jgi:hypothetical protein
MHETLLLWNAKRSGQIYNPRVQITHKMKLKTHLQRRQHTNHEKDYLTYITGYQEIKERKAHNCLRKTSNNNRRMTKSLHCPQLDHHDADE